MKKLSSLPERICFLPADAGRGERSFAVSASLAILLFILTRLAVHGLFLLRHYDPLTADPGDYVEIARFIAAHGRLPATAAPENRLFPGLALPIAAVAPMVGNAMVAGYLISWLSSIASVLLFQAVFRNLRLTLLYVVFVPAWIAPSSMIMSEGVTLFLLLTAIWAVHRERSFGRRIALLFLAGFALVVRANAVFFLAPFLIVWWQEQERKQYGWGRLFVYGAAVSALPLAYLAWNRITIGSLFPQAAAQRSYFLQNIGDGYPASLLAWPGQSIVHGLGLSSVPLAKKLSIVASLILPIFVIVRYARNSARRIVAPDLAVPFAWVTLAHLAFSLCIGGAYGFSSFDRYISQINPVLVKGLGGERRIRMIWIVAAALTGTLFAGLTGHSSDTIPILPFLKPE
jgi:hypothetical protein